MLGIGSLGHIIVMSASVQMALSYSGGSADGLIDLGWLFSSRRQLSGWSESIQLICCFMICSLRTSSAAPLATLFVLLIGHGAGRLLPGLGLLVDQCMGEWLIGWSVGWPIFGRHVCLAL